MFRGWFTVCTHNGYKALLKKANWVTPLNPVSNRYSLSNFLFHLLSLTCSGSIHVYASQLPNGKYEQVLSISVMCKLSSPKIISDSPLGLIGTWLSFLKYDVGILWKTVSFLQKRKGVVWTGKLILGLNYGIYLIMGAQVFQLPLSTLKYFCPRLRESFLPH